MILFGDLWVPDAGSNTIDEYTPQDLANATPMPSVVLRGQSAADLSFPDDIAFDQSGNLWVSNHMNNTVVLFTASQLATSAAVQASLTISSGPNSALAGPLGLAFDPHATNLPLRP